MSTPLLSWGRYPRLPQQPHPVNWASEIASTLAGCTSSENDKRRAFTGGALAYGMGRSYGDSCLAASSNVLSMRSMDRVLVADWTAGVITAQAGMTLDALIRIALPRGWFPPVTPGTRFVTLGGAVANDVHGKNHHVKGTFGCHVRRLVLYRSDEGVVACSPEEHPELFAATVGGLGLTGIIVSVEMQLRRVTSSQIEQRSIRFGNLEEFFDLSRLHDPHHEYSVAWIDCLAEGAHTGRGHYIVGNHAYEGELTTVRSNPLTMPFDPPISLVNALTVRAFNTFYYYRHRAKEIQRRIGYIPFFYPLDGILHWNRMYGRNGFQQFQCVVPRQDAHEVLSAVMTEISRSGTGSFLAVLKQFGDISSPGLLSFPISGVTLALDFPQYEPAISRLFNKLDALVHDAGGRLYPAKDAHMSASHFQQAYPAWQRVEALRDPQLLSRFWKRVT
ncbi:FAD-binding protein [Methylocaldum gracile]